ncbi:hypothetical protein [Rhizobium sp. WYCCWR 11146]|uniref:hypothetical protein n=1 Tax=Rhizobium sp. WYCCWR 11146 TaxID=2749833 RepID=UPI0015E6AD4E|nr:hypothetical protein [Rhizobium sp. WYCCWR 11146]MBA1346008.1 hypothetical protein [Rhizobium sp. WYCCWR 11146]
MSSELTSCSLNTDDLRLLQKVLIDCGYKCEIAGGQSAGPNLAATLLIRLFQDGMTDPIDLADELVRRFGRTEMAAPVEGQLHKDAIRGLFSPSHGGRGSKYHHETPTRSFHRQKSGS